MMDAGILVVDDEQTILNAYSVALRAGGFRSVTACLDPYEALRLIEAQPFALVLLDLAMPGMSGEALLEHARQARPEMPVVIVTAYNDAATAMRCMHAGAYDYVTKPLDRTRLLTTVRRVLDAQMLREENIHLKAKLLEEQDGKHPVWQTILTADEHMQALFRYAEAIGSSVEPVLITGETGTGKDLMANALHVISGRTGEFVVLNVAGLDEQMFSDVLFGHAKGAYTGAAGVRGGLLRKAENGSIFLDEIGDVALALQSRLLRVIESGDYYTGGSDTLCRSSARVIVATNCDVDALRNGARMRPDLYYRRDVHHIPLPPLRERGDDVVLLARAFAESMAEAAGCEPPELEGAAAGVLMQYDWPGNVRELKAVIADAVNTQARVVSAEWLRGKLQLGGRAQRQPDGHGDDRSFPTIREATVRLVRQAMLQAGGNQCQAARLLGISQPALSKRLKHIT